MVLTSFSFVHYRRSIVAPKNRKSNSNKIFHKNRAPESTTGNCLNCRVQWDEKRTTVSRIWCLWWCDDLGTKSLPQLRRLKVPSDFPSTGGLNHSESAMPSPSFKLKCRNLYLNLTIPRFLSKKKRCRRKLTKKLKTRSMSLTAQTNERNWIAWKC